MRESKEAGLAAAKAKGYVKPDEDLEGTDDHYNMFESMISGRDMHNKDTKPGDQFRKMFPAQTRYARLSTCQFDTKGKSICGGL